MKKIVSFLLVMAITLLIIPVNAEAEPAFVVEQVTAAPGETVDVTISVKNNPGIASIKLAVTFDDALTLNSVTYNNAIGGMFMQPQQMTSPATLNWFNGTANTNGDWVFATLSFTVSADAQEGECPIEITYQPNNIYNIAEENLAFGIENGAVKVGAFTDSDIDKFTYELSGNEMTITGYAGTKANLTIAETYEIDGVVYTVTAIGEGAFEGCETLETVDIPATVTSIGDYAFYDCTNLKCATVRNAEAQLGEISLGYYYIRRGEDGLVEGFVLEGYEGSTAQEYALTEGITFSALAVSSDVIYAGDDLEAALDMAAETGKKVVLTQNISLRSVVIGESIVLDLNGYTLTADYFTCYGAVIDGADGGNALVKVNKGAHLATENEFMPIYDTAAGGYRFYKYELQNLGFKTVNSGTVKAGFRLVLANPAGYSVLSTTSDVALDTVSLISWSGSMGVTHYTFNDNTLRNYAVAAAADVANKGTVTKAITLTMTGVDSLGENPTVNFLPTVVTALGMTAKAPEATWTAQ